MFSLVKRAAGCLTELRSWCIRPFACLHTSRPSFGLSEFFENGQSLPPFDPANRKVFGRAWSADELRLKSLDDLQKLWFVLLKETNLLATQKAETRRMGQRWFGGHRVYKCRLSMARIKTVLTERQALHEKAVNLMDNAQPKTEGELLMQAQKRDKMRQLWRKRHFRKHMNFLSYRKPLFV